MFNITLMSEDIEVKMDGSLIIRLLCIECPWEGGYRKNFTHLILIEPHDDIKTTVQTVIDANNSHLTDGIEVSDLIKRQFPEISSASVEKIQQKAIDTWTPEILSIWKQRREEMRIQNEIEEHRRQEEERVQTEIAKKIADEQFEILKERVLADPDILAVLNDQIKFKEKEGQ